MVRKNKNDGTKVINCDVTAFNGLTDRKIFQGLTQLNTDVNELFFAKNVIVVEGPDDKIAITETCKKLGKIIVRSEELDITIVVANGKQNIPFFVRVLNAFKINYVVLHDTDLKPGLTVDAENIVTAVNKKISDVTLADKLVTFPIKLENTLGLTDHFVDQYFALKFFSEHTNINSQLETIVESILKKIST